MTSPNEQDADLILDVEDDIGIITLNRPAKKNAVTLAMWRRLPELVASVESNTAVRVVVVRGAGQDSFAAGSDINELPAVYASPESSADYDRTMLEAQKRLATCSKPVIAMIHGPCVGGGVGIATACDLRFADSGASFCVPPARLGVVYGVSATRRMIDLVGLSTVRDLLFSARTLTAAEAWHLGLVDRVEATDALEDAVLEYAKTISANSAYSVKQSKAILRRIVDEDADDDETYWQTVRDAVAGPDFAEGFSAFRERRKPDFT